MAVLATSVPGNQVPTTFWQLVLEDLGAPATSQNISILQKWSTYENTIASWNPLASEQNKIPGTVASTGIPGAPAVKNYVSQQAGAAETAAELQAIAPKVVNDLQNNVPVSQWGPTEVAEISHWGTHGFAALVSSGGSIGSFAGGVSAPTSATLTDFTGTSSSTPCVNSLADYGTQHPSIVPGAQFLGWAFQPCILKRAGLIILGSALIIFGLKQLGAKGINISAGDFGNARTYVARGEPAPNRNPAPRPKPTVPEPKPEPKADTIQLDETGSIPSSPPPRRRPRDVREVIA